MIDFLTPYSNIFDELKKLVMLHDDLYSINPFSINRKDDHVLENVVKLFNLLIDHSENESEKWFIASEVSIFFDMKFIMKHLDLSLDVIDSTEKKMPDTYRYVFSHLLFNKKQVDTKKLNEFFSASVQHIQEDRLGTFLVNFFERLFIDLDSLIIALIEFEKQRSSQEYQHIYEINREEVKNTTGSRRQSTQHTDTTHAGASEKVSEVTDALSSGIEPQNPEVDEPESEPQNPEVDDPEPEPLNPNDYPNPDDKFESNELTIDESFDVIIDGLKPQADGISLSFMEIIADKLMEFESFEPSLKQLSKVFSI